MFVAGLKSSQNGAMRILVASGKGLVVNVVKEVWNDSMPFEFTCKNK